MEGATMVRIDRKSSIESEPRTLSMNQIQCARVCLVFVSISISVPSYTYYWLNFRLLGINKFSSSF